MNFGAEQTDKVNLYRSFLEKKFDEARDDMVQRLKADTGLTDGFIYKWIPHLKK